SNFRTRASICCLASLLLGMAGHSLVYRGCSLSPKSSRLPPHRQGSPNSPRPPLGGGGGASQLQTGRQASPCARLPPQRTARLLCSPPAPSPRCGRRVDRAKLGPG